MKAVICGFFLHIIFLLSVFDIFFKSPIVNNIPVQNNPVNSPAKRLVLFVADGLRADSFYSIDKNFETPSPYLRSIIETQGVWGVAHARVPTESRPGHIAFIAGFYEDPSAVFTGWQDNLVEFDSLFNRSTVTFSWGSPDIVNMFRKGATEEKVRTLTYDAKDQDFSGQGSPRLNTWVFAEVEKLLRSAKHDDSLNRSLRSLGVVLFLHLLGTDVSGHANKPHSRQYKENIKVIDEGVKRIEQLVNEFYEYDNKTAFVYTSDHGMTDWGSHGDGSASETEVPLVVWGAGARGPRVLETPDVQTPSHWGLSHLQRTDTAQADICPLMAVLVGLSIPVHSVGVVPVDYLSLSPVDKLSALLLNGQQLFAQFKTKRDSVQANMLPWMYRPYPSLRGDEVDLLTRQVATLIPQHKLDLAMLKIRDLIQKSLDGLDYYHSYFETPLLFCVSLLFLGWISWLLCYLLSQSNDSGITAKKRVGTPNPRKTFGVWPDCVFILSIAATVFLIYVQSLPLQFYMYCCLPLVLWWNVLRQVKAMKNILLRYNPLRIVGLTVVAIVLLELLVMTFYKRWVLSVVVACVGLWPMFLGERSSLVSTKVKLLWFLLFLVLAVFPTLPVVGRQTVIEYVILCGGLWLMLGLVSWYCLDPGKVVYSQMLMIASATTVVLLTSWDFDTGNGLQWWNQTAAWLLLVGGLMSPLTTSVQVTARLLSVGLGLAVPFLLLCAGHEAFLLLSLFLSLCLWIYVEACLSKTQVKKLEFVEEVQVVNTVSADDFRKSFFFLMFIILSFFGTGNIASVNSFDVAWVRSFLTTFSPFTMMSLILLKTVIPFLLVTCCFRAVNISSRTRAENMFVIVLIYCDVMSLHFLYCVTNKGSWLQIGTSVSHFVIMEVTVLFLALLYYVAKLYTSSVVGRHSTSDKPIFPLWQPGDHKLKKR